MSRKIKLVSLFLAALCIVLWFISCKKAPTPTPGASQTPNGAELTPSPEESLYTPGTYHAEAMGNNGLIYVDVQLSNSHIGQIEVDANYETAGLGDVAARQVADSIVEAQSLAVDTVAGATYSSLAVINAVKEALTQAGVDMGPMLQPDDASNYNQDLGASEADVIVVGGGMAGMTAALRAVQEGATVILYERSGILGGAARYAMGWISGADFRIQREQGVKNDTADLFYKDIVGFAGKESNVNKELARFYAENSGPAIDWLEDIGVEFKDELNVGIYDPMSVYRVAWGKNNGLSIVQGLENAIAKEVESGKITVHMFTEVSDLVMENDVVKGVRTVDHHGNTGTATAKSTILATGGFGADPERLGAIFKNIAIGYITTASGSGYKLAEQAGAAFHTMHYNPVTGGVLPNNGFYSNIRMNVRYPGVIFVDNTGKRVFDEMGANYKTRSDAWINAPENTLHAILSEGMLNREQPLLSAGNAWTPTPDTEWKLFEEQVQEGKLIIKADTIEELAEKAGLDPKTLTATIESYNTSASNGKDKAFGRTDGLIAFTDGPFYAIKTIPYAGRSAGGPVANKKMQVLNEKGAVIPGLYLAGEIVGFASISGEASVSGMYLGEAATFGISAGINAARRALTNS